MDSEDPNIMLLARLACGITKRICAVTPVGRAEHPALVLRRLPEDPKARKRAITVALTKWLKLRSAVVLDVCLEQRFYRLSIYESEDSRWLNEPMTPAERASTNLRNKDLKDW